MILIPIIQALSGLYVLVVGLIALNRMCPCTSHRIRLSYLAMTCGALAAVVDAFMQPNIAVCIFVTGVALYALSDRRHERRTQRRTT